MKMPLILKTGRRTLVVAFAVIAPWVVELANAAPLDTHLNRDEASTSRDSAVNEADTLPATRPEQPQLSPDAQGAQGPLRSGSDQHEPYRTDPAIRDTNPLTVNGLWETLPGNVVVRPRSP